GDDVGVWERARMDTGGHQSGDVRHVDEEQGADAVGDLGEAREVDRAGVGRGARDDELRPDLGGDGGQRLVVDALRLPIDAVGVNLVHPAGEVHGRAVGEMPAVGEVHAQDPVARVEHAEVGGHVRLPARVRLHVDVLRAGEE